MIVKLTDIYEDDDIKSSAYYNSLNQSIKHIENLNEFLDQKLLLNNKKENKFLAFINNRISVLGLIVLISNSLPLLFNVNALSIMFSSIISYILFIIAKLKNYELKSELIKTKISTLENIYNYLTTEQEIIKDMKYLLSSSIIYQSEDLLQTDMKIVMKSKRQKSQKLQSINYKYENKYKNNLIILEKLDNLDDTQKQKYLFELYSNTNNDTTYSNDNIVNKSIKNFGLIDDSIVLSTDNKTIDDNTTGESTNTKPNPNIKPISLKKEGKPPYYEKNGIIYIYGDPMPPLFQKENEGKFQDVNAINTPNELNSIFTYQQGEVPPRAQEELEKGRQFSKKLPK